MVGPPGAGKGTQAEFIAKRSGVPKISTGDIFRSNVSSETALGLKAKAFMDRGDLVPDDVTVDMVRSRLAEADVLAGFLLDGFPRTVPQAETLDDMLRSGVHSKIDVVLQLLVEDAEVIRRLSGRRTCRSCSRVWHVDFDPPAVVDRCDVDDGELYQRDDDQAATIANRLHVYAQQTSPLVSFYADRGILVAIPAAGAVAVVTQRAMEAIQPFARP